VSSRLASLQKAETQNTGTSRLRSDSNLSAGDAEAEGVYPHPVSSRASTPILPPVLVSSIMTTVMTSTTTHELHWRIAGLGEPEADNLWWG
jgi:hypothetical protein